MSRPIENVKNKNGDEIYPITCTGAVVTQSGEMLEDVIDNLESVSANVEVPSDVTPTELSNLKIGSDYYSAPSGVGGITLYEHNIYIEYGSSFKITFKIINDSSVAFNRSMLEEYFINNGLNYYTKSIPAGGHIQNGINICIYYDNSNSNLKVKSVSLDDRTSTYTNIASYWDYIDNIILL